MDKISYRIGESLMSRLLRKALFRGGDYADVFIEHKQEVFIQLEDDKIEKIINGIDSGIGIRVISNNKSAYAYSNDFSEDSLLSLAEAVSKAGREKKDLTFNLKKIKPHVRFDIRLAPTSVGIERKISLLEDANRIARKIDKRIRQVSLTYRDLTQNIYIATSDGTISEDERIHTLVLIHVVASDNGVLQTGYEPVGGLIGFELFEDPESFKEIVSMAAKRAVMMLGAREAPGGRMPVVVSSEAGGTMIHEAVGHGLEADFVQEGLSVYSNKIGQEVASPLITVIDDATLPNKRGSFSFDDEGVPSQRTILIEKGVLKGYMYDRLTAMKDRTVSTGNGRRESYECRPIPRMTNTFIAPGDSDPSEVVKSVDKGLFVRKMGGGQVNTVTGEFVFEVSEGYLIEHGQIGEPLRGATLIGRGPDILKSIDMVGNDIGFSIGTCGKDAQGVPVSDAMPTIRIPEIVVGGKI
jgi:TldD protein